MPDTIRLRSILEDDARIPVSIDPVEKEGLLRRLLRKGAAGGAAKGFNDVLVNTFGGEGVQGFDADTTEISARILTDGRSIVTISAKEMPALELRRPAPDAYEFSLAGIGVWSRCDTRNGRDAVDALLTRIPS